MTVPGAQLYIDRPSPVHRLAPEAAIVGLVAFTVLVATTPRAYIVAIAVEAVIVATVMAWARLRPAEVLRRMVVVLPFLGVAVLTPFVAGGETTSVLGIEVSTAGLWGAWNVTTKATLGAAAGVVFASTKQPMDVVRGLTRLRVPATLVGIVGFMFRYLDVLVAELSRMRRAMAARGHDARRLTQARPLATSVGTLFVRSYERGERTHRAMLARGYDGRLPDLDERRASAREWAGAVVPALLGALMVLVVGAIRP